MAVADEGLELAGSETVQEGDRLSLGDTTEEEASTDEVDPCRKRCGRDHGVVLEECRLAFTTVWGALRMDCVTACVWLSAFLSPSLFGRKKYVELVKLELGLLQLRHRQVILLRGSTM